MSDANKEVGGPIDDFVMAKLRAAVLTLTDPVRLGAAIHEFLPELFPATVADLASHASDKLRAVLLPLVK